MATIKIRNNPDVSYDFLYLAANDVSVEGIIDITNGPYVFHSIQEDSDVAKKNITVSMVDPGTGNTLEADHSIASITGTTATGSMRFELGNQINIKGSSGGFVVDRASATVLFYSTRAGSNFKGLSFPLNWIPRTFHCAMLLSRSEWATDSTGIVSWSALTSTGT